MVVNRSKIGLIAQESVLLPISRHSSVTFGHWACDAEVWNTVLVTCRRSRHGRETQLRLSLLVLLYLLRKGSIVFL